VVNVVFSEEQEMLRKTARAFLAEKCPPTSVKKIKDSKSGYSPELWKEMAELGWMGLVFPEKYGGNNMSFLDLAVLVEEMGRACLPSPYFSTVILGGLPIMNFGSEVQKKEHLPRIVGGEEVVSLALTEPNARYDASGVEVKATVDANGYVINGTKLFVPDANVADFILVATRTDDKAKPEDGVTIFIVDAKTQGMNYVVLDTIAKDKLCELAFDQVKVKKETILGQLNQGWTNVQKIMEWAAVAKCCEMVGGAQAVLDMTVDYAKQRIQFGQPIGSFQAIQHHCADMLIDVDTSRLITYEAALMISKGLPCSKEVAMSKAWVSEAYRRVVILGHQVHGGVSLIEDHNMPLYFKQAKAAELAFGGVGHYRGELANMLKSGNLRPIEIL
jgi:alkylation response protein AidB-like acyl-CoA dehydrogenase